MKIFIWLSALMITALSVGLAIFASRGLVSLSHLLGEDTRALAVLLVIFAGLLVAFSSVQRARKRAAQRSS